jgi:predicted RNase H-like nuclease (RuvC/YqgF family)
MGPLELFAILVLAGAIIVLLYYYLQETKSASLVGVRSSISQMGSKVSEGIHINNNTTQTPEGDKKMSGVSERVSEMSEMLKGKVNVPISTDSLSGRIDEFLDEQSDRLIKDWELATKSDIGTLEKKYDKVSREIDDLERRFNEYRGHANKKFEHIEERLKKLEGKDEETE